MSQDATLVAVPPAPPLPSDTKTSAGRADSLKSKTPLKAVSGSPSKTSSPRGKPPASPNCAKNSSPYSQKREASRDKIRNGL